MGAEVNADQEFTFLGFPRDDGIGSVAALHYHFVGVHAEPAFNFRLGVTANAIALENRLNILPEIRARGKNRQGRCKCAKGANHGKGWFGGRGVLDKNPE